MTSITHKNKRMSMADQLSNEMNLLLKNTDLNKTNYDKSMYSPSIGLSQMQKHNSTTSYSNNKPINNSNGYSNDYIPHSSLSSSYMLKNNNNSQNQGTLRPEYLEERYKSIYETTESSSVYTNDINNSTITTTTAISSDTPSEEDGYTTTSMTTSVSRTGTYSDMTTTEQYSEYTSVSELPTEQFSEYSETSTEPSSIIQYNNNDGQNPNIYSSHYGYNNNINNSSQHEFYQIENRPSRSIHRWSQQDIGNRRNHSLDSRKSHRKEKHKKNSRERNRSLSPSIKNLLVDTSHLSNLYNTSHSSTSSYITNNNNILSQLSFDNTTPILPTSLHLNSYPSSLNLNSPIINKKNKRNIDTNSNNTINNNTNITSRNEYNKKNANNFSNFSTNNINYNNNTYQNEALNNSNNDRTLDCIDSNEIQDIRRNNNIYHNEIPMSNYEANGNDNIHMTKNNMKNYLGNDDTKNYSFNHNIDSNNNRQFVPESILNSTPIKSKHSISKNPSKIKKSKNKKKAQMNTTLSSHDLNNNDDNNDNNKSSFHLLPSSLYGLPDVLPYQPPSKIPMNRNSVNDTKITDSSFHIANDNFYNNTDNKENKTYYFDDSPQSKLNENYINKPYNMNNNGSQHSGLNNYLGVKSYKKLNNYYMDYDSPSSVPNSNSNGCSPDHFENNNNNNNNNVNNPYNPLRHQNNNDNNDDNKNIPEEYMEQQNYDYFNDITSITQNTIDTGIVTPSLSSIDEQQFASDNDYYNITADNILTNLDNNQQPLCIHSSNPNKNNFNIIYNNSDNNSTTINNNYSNTYEIDGNYKNDMDGYYNDNINNQVSGIILDSFTMKKDDIPLEQFNENEMNNNMIVNNYDCIMDAFPVKKVYPYEKDIVSDTNFNQECVDFYQDTGEDKELTEKSESYYNTSIEDTSYTLSSSARERFNAKKPPYPLNPNSKFYKPPNPRHHQKKSKKKQKKHSKNFNRNKDLEEGYDDDIRRKHSLVKPERSRRINKFLNYARDNSNYVIVENNLTTGDANTYQDEDVERQKLQELKRQSNFFAKKNAIDPEYGKGYDEASLSSNSTKNKSFKNKWWATLAKTCTCCVPKACLVRCHKTDPDVQQAWREKVTLCIIIFCICLISGFFTFGINMIVCNSSEDKIYYADSSYSIHGISYDIYISKYDSSSRLHSVIGMSNGHDLGQYFLNADPKNECNQIMNGLYGQYTCSSEVIGEWLQEAHKLDKTCYTMDNILSDPNINTKKIGNIYYNWKDLEELKDQRKLVVYNGNVLDITDFLAKNHTLIGNDLETILRNHNAMDITYTMTKNSQNRKVIKCMNEIYKVGTIGKTTSGCIIGNIILALTLIFVTGVMFIKFCMAVIFSWLLKWPLGDRYGIIRKIGEKERRYASLPPHNNGNIDSIKMPISLWSDVKTKESRNNVRDSITTLINKSNSNSNTILQNSAGINNDTGGFDINHNNNYTLSSATPTMEKMTSSLTPSNSTTNYKSQNRKSMTSRFSIPMPGEGSRLKSSQSISNIVMPKYPNPFRAESISNNNSFTDLTAIKRNSINWEPTHSSSPSFNSVLNKKNTACNTPPPLGNIFNHQISSSPSLLANSNNSMLNDTVKTLPEPTLPDMGILDDELPPSSSPSTFTNKRLSMPPNMSLSINRFSTLKSTSGNDQYKPINGNSEESSGGPLTPNSTIKDLLHTILLVTCYSEGHDGIANTLDSLANTDYHDSHKLIIVICDGLVKGEGNDGLTSDIVINMIDPGDGSNYHDNDQEAKSYVAIAEGEKRHNMAKIYAGWYRYALKDTGRRVPMIGIIKCGTEQERYGSNKSPKPGNRGKRDSQVLLLGFLSRALFNERMTEFDFDLFTKIYKLTGVHADGYESIMMVDADTIVDKDSLAHLTACLIQDPKIMGLCGETKICNKTQSWVTMIQVFEYYISHHMSKAFESVFGGVTCLPGCFCMYRIKSRKGDHGYWVPILANPEIVEQYSENVVDTLHKKNLLLLGEDRYLSTLMLREFPKRKMVFVPQATCHTIVPSEFKVLLSQRRRWINSTIHNLLELVLVNDLCGTFCISMQFVVFMELIGTMVLPAAVLFTYYLIINAIFSSQKHIFTLCLMAVIMGLPAILIGLTSRKIKYILWMLVYLLALPVWNFILPVYSFWHFDDFSWGQTRVVEGEKKTDKSGHTSDGKFDSTGIIMKKWEEWEKLRRVGILMTESKEGDLGEHSKYNNK
ncbi:hypothetical protein BCR36DRAFT_343227 [Piromyces finnis]|uniref:chitin synthase n=1 Tax=Piromyces finnis TaxID=1754191 RepID=A0A1Y1VLE4_9FUNG|nr:hypothetical protein BCR36DRAFT_343227 [Piromyces finnis]|eukprot:ORX59278.1 hypothetical protein BCR36DRAFT_343227 [Piromyces finnis]